MCNRIKFAIILAIVTTELIYITSYVSSLSTSKSRYSPINSVDFKFHVGGGDYWWLEKLTCVHTYILNRHSDKRLGSIKRRKYLY
jgi:hypothetical protein